MDIKLDGKPVPTRLLQGRTDELSDAIRRVMREAEGFYISEQAE
jgi:hypothetical protein